MRRGRKLLDRFIAYAEDGELEKVKSILDRHPELVNARWEYGWTALHRAAVFGHADVVGFLLARGADIAAKDLLGKTPLHSAASGGKENLAALHLLVSSGAPINARSNRWEPPIMDAIVQGSVVCFAYLLARGARLDYRNRHGLDCLGMVEYQLEPAPGPEYDDSDYRVIKDAILAQRQLGPAGAGPEGNP